VDVTVIDVRDGSFIPDETVVVAGGRITTVGASASTPVPARARRVDGRGKFLLPGLWDMDVRLDSDPLVLQTMLEAGITGVREMDNDAADVIEIRRQVDARLIAGPRIIFAVPDAGSPSLARVWLVPVLHRFYFSDPGEWESMRASFHDRVSSIRQSGASILTGSGWGALLAADGAPPAWSLHAELDALVDAGFTPAEVVRAATLNPALFLGVSNSFGTVEAGKTADLLVLDANPLVDIRNTRRIFAVVSNGTLAAEER
jgi:imidazolonepropionase-like amidohydrolase